MPTPPRTSLVEIIAAGRSILEDDGLRGLTMQRVAQRVGVRSPSLYKRIRDRGQLIRLIADDIGGELARTLDAVARGDDPAEDLRAIGHAFRSFALAHPNGYGLLFARLPDDVMVEPEPDANGVETLLRTTSRLAGPDDALEAARTVTAWAHGFVTMELAGAFRLGGDVDRAFEYGIEHLVRALEA